jgi:hypothetical protein
MDSLGVLADGYSYTNGVQTGTTPGDGGTFTISPQVLLGLSGPVAAPLWASLTDPLGNVTRELLDGPGVPPNGAYGRPVELDLPRQLAVRGAGNQ